MSDNNEIDMERKFLHDLATPLSILILSAKRLKKTVLEDANHRDMEVYIKILDQMTRSIDTIENLHADHKQNITVKAPEPL
jgi:K+-sensing histidine kinase KdpD